MISKYLDIFLSHLAVERGLSRNTLSAYRADLTALFSYLDENQLEISPQALKVFLGVNKNSSATSDRQLSCFKTFFRYLSDEGVINQDPTFGLHPKNKVLRLPKSLSSTQINELIDALPKSTPANVRDLLLIELLYGTGVRISESTGIDLEDIDHENRWIKIKFGKGAKQRLVPIGSELDKILKNYLVLARPELVKNRNRISALFVSQRGARLTRQAAWLIVKRAAALANLSVELSPHTLRHTFATHLLAGGADIRVVQELLGHSAVTTTQIYTKVNIDQIRETFLLAHPRAS